MQDANEDGPSLAAAQANIAELREDGWLDESVLSASLVLVVFNARLMRYATATATFVFSKGGSVPKSLHTTSIPAQLGVFNEHVRLSALAIALLAIDTILVLRRVLGVWFRCQESVGRIYEQDKQQVMAQYSQGFAPSRARMRLQRARTQRARTQRRNLQHFGLLAQHAGVKRLREAEEQANHWAWLCVELVEVCSQWAYTTLVLLVSAQTARVNAAFDSAVDGDDASAPLALSDRDGMDAVLRLVYTLIDAGTLTSYLTYVASLTVILLLIRLFRVRAHPKMSREGAFSLPIRLCAKHTDGSARARRSPHARAGAVARNVVRAVLAFPPPPEHDLVYFGLIFTLITACFAVAGMLIFGAVDRSFVTFGDAVSTLLLAMLSAEASIDFDQLEFAAVGRAYFWSYMIVAFVLMLNVLLAIIINAYASTTQGCGDEPSLLAVALDVAVNAMHDASALVRTTRDRAARLCLRAPQPAAISPTTAALQPTPQPLTAERRDELMQQLSVRAGPIGDAQIARLLLESTDELLSKGAILTLADLVQLFGAVAATRVLARYGEFGESAPGSECEAAVGRTLHRTGRGVDKLHDGQRELLHASTEASVHKRSVHVAARHAAPPLREAAATPNAEDALGARRRQGGAAGSPRQEQARGGSSSSGSGCGDGGWMHLRAQPLGSPRG